MNKLTTLTLVAVAMMVMSLTGCCRGWPRWFSRGDACATHTTGMGMYEGADYASGPALMAPTVLPQTLPGPAMPN